MPVRQAARLLDLLEHFGEQKRPLLLPEVSSALAWPRSSTYNLIRTLSDRGYIYETGPRAGFYPSPLLNALIEAIAIDELLPAHLKELVTKAAEATGETVSIATASGTNAIFLYSVESPAAMRFAAKKGLKVPIHATSSGRALLEQYTRSERSALLAEVRYERHSGRTLMSSRQVEEEIERSVKRGWHQNIDGHVAGLSGIALALGVPGRQLSISIGGPTSRIRDKIPELVRALTALLESRGFLSDLP